MELKKSLSVNSWGIWFLMANKVLLENIYKKLVQDDTDYDEVIQEIKMAANLNCSALNGAKETVAFTSMGLGVNALAQRDTYLQLADKDLPKDEVIQLRSAPFNGRTLFEGHTDRAKKVLKEVKETNERKIVVNIDTKQLTGFTT